MIDQDSSRDLTNALVERSLRHLTLLNVKEGEIHSQGKKYQIQGVVDGNGLYTLEEDYVSAKYIGDKGSYQLKLRVTDVVLANGITVKYRIIGWDNIRYLAIGHTENKGFRHVKIANPSEGEWVTFSIGYQDIAYGLKNNWQKPNPEQISDIRLYVSGTPSDEGARIELMLGSTWLEETESSMDWMPTVINNGLNDAIKKYFIRCNPCIKQQVDSFFKSGHCPLTGEAKLLWPIHQSKPDGMDESGTYRYLWHAMQPAIAMMVHAKDTETSAPIFAARDFITCWLENSYFSADLDTKYTWYDHGTAERLLALLFMHDIGIEEQFDYRFMTRLKLTIFKHAQLLESEVFYAAHQPTRYHNHAWFQDMALIAVAVAMPGIPCATRWLDRGIERLTNQLDHLIVRDNGYAIFVENSIGYHHGIQKLVEFAGELVMLSGRDSDIPKIADELSAWSDFLRYPDHRSPSQGDTFRQPNPSGGDIKRGVAYDNPGCTILPSAGYAVVKGNHNQTPFMLCMFATSLCKTHKHEDNLSVTLFFDGVEWLIDPSFYSHEYDQLIPAYLRSAWAHNNVAISGANYSIDPGKSVLEGDAGESDYKICGRHTAYDGFEIQRILHGFSGKLDFRITDQAISEHKKDVEVFGLLHLGEGVSVTILDEGIELTHPGSDYRLLIAGDNLNPNVFEGWCKGENVHGVSGLGFIQAEDRVSISLPMRLNEACSWTLKLK